MKNAIKEYLGPTDSEKQDLLKTAIIVFDTNVFLNLYRYSKPTRDALIQIMVSCKDRLWMPYQVAKEFMKNRPEVILETMNKYEGMVSAGEKLVQEFANSLRIKQSDESCEELKSTISNWVDNKKNINLEVTSCNEDTILAQILELFDGKVGSEFDDEMIGKIKKEGKERYAKKIPPGYMDSKKISGDDDNNAYGDLIYWKEILEYAKGQKCDIILVTSDQKEDWWTIVKGRTIGPRPELLKEFYTITSQKMYMYEMNNFINIVDDEAIDETITDEVKLVNAAQIQPEIPVDLALKLMGIDPSSFSNLQDQIDHLNRKNSKRRNQIINLKRRIKKGIATPEDYVSYDSNIQYLERDEKLVHQLEEELLIGYAKLMNDD